MEHQKPLFLNEQGTRGEVETLLAQLEFGGEEPDYYADEFDEFLRFELIPQISQEVMQMEEDFPTKVELFQAELLITDGKVGVAVSIDGGVDKVEAAELKVNDDISSVMLLIDSRFLNIIFNPDDLVANLLAMREALLESRRIYTQLTDSRKFADYTSI